MSHVEQPDYRLVSSKESIEIREYSPMIVAEVEVSGERKQAIREGFQVLADYIFGNNTSHIKMEMTAPVIQRTEWVQLEDWIHYAKKVHLGNTSKTQL